MKGRGKIRATIRYISERGKGRIFIKGIRMKRLENK